MEFYLSSSRRASSLRGSASRHCILQAVLGQRMVRNSCRLWIRLMLDCGNGSGLSIEGLLRRFKVRGPRSFGSLIDVGSLLVLMPPLLAFG